MGHPIRGVAFLIVFGLVLSGHQLVGQEPAGAAFKDRANELGLQLSNSHACWSDVDNDGWSDLFAGGIVWRNEGGKKFSKLAEGVGEVVAADFNNDGFADLFSFTALRLFLSDSGKRFTPLAMPELPACVSLGACCGDFNGDSFVDVYVGGYEGGDAEFTYPSLLLLSEQGKSFKLARSEAKRRTRGVTACDFDEDGDLDVYVSNYRLQPNQLWLNDGAGKFTDDAVARNAVATSAGFKGGHSIGAVWGDFDHDGHFDLFAGNFAHVDDRGDQPKSRFLRNLGRDKSYVFEDRGECGVFYQESYASPCVGDFDGDTNLDLFFTTVYGVASFERQNNPALFRNEGAWKFADGTATAQLAGLPPTYQAAAADFDQDGDLDLVTAGKLFENQSAPRHWLAVSLEGDGTTVNRSAIGAQVRVSLPDRTLARQVEAGTGEGNQNDLRLHFGLGDHAQPVRLEIRWPHGKTQVMEHVAIDQLAKVRFEKS